MHLKLPRVQKEDQQSLMMITAIFAIMIFFSPSFVLENAIWPFVQTVAAFVLIRSFSSLLISKTLLGKASEAATTAAHASLEPLSEPSDADDDSQAALNDDDNDPEWLSIAASGVHLVDR